MATFTPVADAADLTAVEDILKEVFVSDTLESQLYEDTWLLDQIEDVTEYTDSNGLKAVVPLKVGRTGAVGARAIGQLLPVADHQKVNRAEYEYTNQYVTVQLNGPVIARMKSNRTSVVREIAFEIDGSIEDVQHDWTRQLHGFSTGAITRTALPGGASSTTVLLGADNYFVIEQGLVYEGMHVDIGTVANPTLDTGGNKVVGIVDSSSAPGIVLENATATTAGSHISLTGNRTANTSNELNGMAGMFSTSTVLGGLDPSTYSWWKANVHSNGGTPRALSIDLLMTTIRSLRQKGKYPDKAMGDLFQEQKYYNLLQGQVRFAGDHNLGAGDSQGLALGRIKSGFVGDPDCLPGRVYMWHSGAIQMYSAGPIAWQNQTTGGNILAWSQLYDAFVARAAKYFQVGTNRRRSMALLSDLSTS